MRQRPPSHERRRVPVAASPPRAQQSHSASLAASPDGSTLFVVHPDADSVSVVRVATRSIVRDVSLAPSAPSVSAKGRYEPSVGPRALAVDSAAATLYVTGQRSGKVYVVDVASGSVKASAVVCSEPVGVLVSADDADVFVACAQDDELVELRTSDLAVVATVPCPRKPWALAWEADKKLLATHLLGPGVSAFTTTPLALEETWTLADGPPQPAPDAPESGEDPTEPHGVVRGLYDVAAAAGDVRDVGRAPHARHRHPAAGARLPVDTVFPCDLDPRSVGARSSRASRCSPTPATAGVRRRGLGAARAGVLGRRRLRRRGRHRQRRRPRRRRHSPRRGRARPTAAGPHARGHRLAADELYVQERNTEDIAAFRVALAGGAVSIEADGAAFPSLAKDPMPANLRLGQQLFYSANSDEYPLTQNHWVACASCHLEGRSDAVTWQFAQGPRDTPTNAGGLLDTGFLFRTADRSQVQDYWRTIDVEQGGHFDIDQPPRSRLLDALADYVNEAIATPVPPSTDVDHTIRGQALVDLRARGEAVFTKIGCDTCHSGPAKTDSGAGNPSLNLAGPTVSSLTTGGVLLHDVGTCVTTGPSTDVAHDDIDGDPRAACAFDTPALRGLADSAPYLHDGSAATLDAVVPIMLKATTLGGPPEPTLSAGDQRALVEYLRSL